MISIETDTQAVQCSDGTTMNLFTATPVAAGDRRAGIIVLQEIFGVNHHIREVTSRFAREGYHAVAPDLFHRTAPGFDVKYSDMSGMEHAKALTEAGLRADLEAAHAALSEELLRSESEANIATVGFCMGGRVSFCAGAWLPVRAAVSFYGGGIQGHAELAAAQQGRALLFWAGRDPHITSAHRRTISDALDAANKPYVEVLFSEAKHGFFCDEREAYHPVVAKEAWALLVSFLHSNVG